MWKAFVWVEEQHTLGFLYSKITVEDRFLHKFIFCVPVTRLFKYSYQKILLHIIRRTFLNGNKI